MRSDGDEDRTADDLTPMFEAHPHAAKDLETNQAPIAP